MIETKVIANKINSNLFRYTAKTKLFVQEVSCLGKSFNHTSQIWNDSMDAGFVMVGERSDKELIFMTESIDMKEDEIQGWWFKALPEFNKGIITETVRTLIIND